MGKKVCLIVGTQYLPRVAVLYCNVAFVDAFLSNICQAYWQPLAYLILLSTVAKIVHTHLMRLDQDQEPEGDLCEWFSHLYLWCISACQ